MRKFKLYYEGEEIEEKEFKTLSEVVEHYKSVIIIPGFYKVKSEEAGCYQNFEIKGDKKWI